MSTPGSPNILSLRRRSLPTGKLDPSDQKALDDRKKVREKWGDVLKKVKQMPAAPQSFDEKVGAFVSAKTDQKEDRLRKARLVFLSVGIAILGLAWAGVYYVTNHTLGVYIMIAYSLSSLASIGFFAKVKSEISFCKVQILLGFTFPMLAQITSPSLPIGSVSIWSSLAPIAALFYISDTANYWFGAFVGCHVFMVVTRPGLAFEELVQVASLLLLHAVIYFTMKTYMLDLKSTKQKFGVLNTFLHLHNRKLTGETAQLKTEVRELEEELTKRDTFDVVADSPAEEIIKIMRAFKDSEAFKGFDREIDFVIRVVGSGKDMYMPDMKRGLNRLDVMTRSFLINFQENLSSDVSSLSQRVSSPMHTTRRVDPYDGTDLNADPQLRELAANVGMTWDLDIFQIDSLTNGRPLYFVGMALFKAHRIIEKFHLDEKKVERFLTIVEAGYRKDNPYHNNTHAADVAQSLSFLMRRVGLENFTDTEIFAAIFAALIHDLDHPGVNNAFEINVSSAKALTYNDKSVLENYHLSAAFNILKDETANIVAHLPKETRTELRSTAIELVLATDFGRHLEVLGQFNSRRAAEGLSFKDKKEDRLLCLKMILKCADISHTSKIPDLHLQWTALITEEFFRQGDREKQLQLPVSAFMDREKPDLPKSQAGFLEFLVLPLYRSFTDMFPNCKELLEKLETNLQHWKRLEELKKKA